MLRALLAALISGEAKAFAGRARTAAALYLLASVALAAGIAFLVGAAFLLAAERFGSLRAAIGFGLGFVVAGAGLLAVNALLAGAWRRKRKAERGAEFRALAATAALVALPSLLKSRTGLVGLLLPVVGLVALKILDENRQTDGGRDDEPS
jgi:hypothetical protein